MAKTRMMKHDLRTSEKVASWPIPIRYFWTLLWGYVDDHGKAKDNPLLVKADCFPLDPDITAETIDEWLWHLADAHVVVRYTVEGTDYLAVINWGEHQKPPHPTKDVLPAFNDPRATRRDLHASRMKDAGEPSASLTHGLGWVGSEFGSGFGLDAHQEAGDSEPPLFDEVWSHWPKKEDKKDAATKWPKAVKEARMSESELAAIAIAHGDAYREHKTRQFTPALVVWLNKARWNNPLPEAEQNGKPTRTEQNLSVVAQYAAAEQPTLEITG